MIECNTNVEELNFIRKKNYEIMLRKKVYLALYQMMYRNRFLRFPYVYKYCLDLKTATPL